MPDNAAPQALADVRATVGNLRVERAATVEELARQSQAVRTSQAEAATRAAAGDAAGAAAAQAQADAARAASRVASDRLAALDGDATAAIGGLVALDPCDAEPDVPLVLLPVRLETRFTAGGDGLMVRMYPDDVHVDALDEGLDD